MNRESFRQYLRSRVQRLQGKDYLVCAPNRWVGYDPSSLRYYYRDFSAKIAWPGMVDKQGIPLVRMVDSEPFYHPMLLAQIALGHWNLWIHGERTDQYHQAGFRRIADWLLQNQDATGGWPILTFQRDPSFLSPYSAMAQGQVTSVLLRAWEMTGEARFECAASRAIDLMLTPMDRKGTCWYHGTGLLLEEYPQQRQRSVLNGWIHALYGLYEYNIVLGSLPSKKALDQTMSALVSNLHRYDAGYWSFYDGLKKLANGYYHREHISQLFCLSITFPHHKHVFDKYRKRFVLYQYSPVHRAISLPLRLLRHFSALRTMTTTWVRDDAKGAEGQLTVAVVKTHTS